MYTETLLKNAKECRISDIMHVRSVLLYTHSRPILSAPSDTQKDEKEEEEEEEEGDAEEVKKKIFTVEC